MGYLISKDYLAQIQDVNLQQVISSNTSILRAAERTAQNEAKSFLKQKYETDQEFTDTTQWDKTAPYSAADRVYLDATAYSATATSYAVGAFVVYSSKVYVCITAISAPEAFAPSKWEEVGDQYQVFYAAYPHPYFDYLKAYKVGDKVFWNNSIYTCLVATAVIDHVTALQYGNTKAIPQGNVFPNDSVNGAIYWKFEEAYLVPANTDITDEAFWTDGDNRDLQMVEKLIDITLYHVHSRITPRNIPALREVRYMGNKEDRVMNTEGRVIYPVYSALGWLQACSRGEVTPNLPLIQPKSGARIRYGSNVKNVNSY